MSGSTPAARMVALGETVAELSAIVRRLAEDVAEVRTMSVASATEIALLAQHSSGAVDAIARLRAWAHEGNGTPPVSTRIAALEAGHADLVVRLERLTAGLEAQAVRRGTHWVGIAAAVISGAAGAAFAAWWGRG